jgi:hypothetical protein
MFGFNPAPKPKHGRGSKKAKQRGEVSPEVYAKAYERSGGRCEKCKWEDGIFDKTGLRWRIEAAHLVRRWQLDETTENDVAMLCSPQQNKGTCHWWVDHTREGREWAENFRNVLAGNTKGANQ